MRNKDCDIAWKLKARRGKQFEQELFSRLGEISEFYDWSRKLEKFRLGQGMENYWLQ